ncbi:co-chaperone DjlA [Neptuniibacter sp. CAU 1671]|uniref:co-chaperone DjlA n=1 Tax=Neptuniibacter sp. CAU 1671 TaxID=3032593 RepID=UPI0023DB0B80|nr:co-chaperone DjlA [Neptuniibacter sp. CAU 1671]MDF2181439.1 co-chaperone DjlA [Neptuniibacter sp. CAU 1671]
MAFDPQQAGAQVATAYQRHTGAILIGALIGLFSGGFVGLLLGGFVGYMISRALKGAISKVNPQMLFFKATFSLMGRIAKSDGRVTEDEIQFARAVMAQMRLDELRRKEAIEHFTRGKDEDFDLEAELRPLAILLRHRPNVKLMFVEIQLQAAMADGEISAAERQVLERMFRALELGNVNVEEILARVKAQRDFYRHGQSGVDPQTLLKDAYAVLGVAPDASDAEVKKAYRRQMSQHHPDKLVSRGLPEEMQELAKEKSQEIQAAYERIKSSRR